MDLGRLRLDLRDRRERGWLHAGWRWDAHQLIFTKFDIGRFRLAGPPGTTQQPRAFVPRTADSDPALRAAPNRLLGLPVPTAPNRVWVGNITHLPWMSWAISCW